MSRLILSLAIVLAAVVFAPPMSGKPTHIEWAGMT
jgi:hypothetical protein